jgi:hypothetical protein
LALHRTIRPTVFDEALRNGELASGSTWFSRHASTSGIAGAGIVLLPVEVGENTNHEAEAGAYAWADILDQGHLNVSLQS